MAATFSDVVEWWATAQPDNIAFCFDKTETVTFKELEAWTGRLIHHLVSKGLQPGDRIGVFSANSLEWCVAAIAAMRAGAILVPLNYRYTPHEVAAVILDCAPAFVFTDEARSGRIGELPEPLPAMLPLTLVRELRTGERVTVKNSTDPDATMVITYTSGSTAKPKGVMFTHRSVLFYAYESMLNYPVHRVGAKAINVAPLYTGGGTIQMMHFFVLGMTNFFEREFNAERALQLLIDEKIEIFCGVPTFFERVAAAPGFAAADLTHIKLAATGGSRVPLPLLKAWRDKGVVVRQLYGLTEGGGNTTLMSEKGALEYPEKCGRGGVFTKHRVVDENGKDVTVGEPGEILVQGPAVMKGYWNAPEATAATFVDGWLRTGDVGMMDEDGNITIVDRLKDIIISGGLNIWSLDIENVIGEMAEVDEVAVIAAKDDKFGETPMAVIYASRPIDVSAVIAFCNARLADYKVPRYVALESEPLPRLATGKIAKRALKDRYANAADTLERVR